MYDFRGMRAVSRAVDDRATVRGYAARMGKLGGVPPLAVDTALAVSFTVVSVLLGQKPPPEGWGHLQLDAVGYALIGMVNLPMVARRTAPVIVLVLICGAWTVFIAAGYWPVVNSLGPLLAVYTVAATRPVRTAVAGAALMGIVWVYAGRMGEQSSMATVVAQSLVFPAVMCRFGFTARQSTERAERLAELTEQLRREQEEREQRAVAEEKGRIARELHDVVAHHMSVISVQSGMAGYVFTADPSTAREALDTISDTAREALEEMRRMLQVLRVGQDEPDSYSPMPRLARLGEMVERVRGAGVSVELQVAGEARPLAPGVELCAYRIVQEALTNVVKHAPAARTAVLVEYESDQLTVSVSNDGGRTVPATIAPLGGHGLIGMRERARLYGGTVEIGPLAEGGFSVRLILPTSARTGSSRYGQS
ncbi:sensor histidine kinase [Streptomyces mirabilis]